MDAQSIIQALNELDPEELKKVEKHLQRRRELAAMSNDEWLAALETAVDNFWGDASAEEKQSIIEAINTKSKPSEKGL